MIISLYLGGRGGMLLRGPDPGCRKNRIDRVGFVNMKALLLVKETFF